MLTVNTRINGLVMRVRAGVHDAKILDPRLRGNDKIEERQVERFKEQRKIDSGSSPE